VPTSASTLTSPTRAAEANSTVPESEGETAHPHPPRITPGVSVLLERRQTLLRMVSAELPPTRTALRMAIPSASAPSLVVAKVAAVEVAVVVERTPMDITSPTDTLRRAFP